MAGAAPVPLLDESYAWPHHPVAWQDDEFAPSRLDALDDGAFSMGYYVHGLCTLPSAHVHYSLHQVASVVLAIATSHRSRHSVLSHRRRYHIHDQQQGYRCCSGVLQT